MKPTGNDEDSAFYSNQNTLPYSSASTTAHSRVTKGVKKKSFKKSLLASSSITRSTRKRLIARGAPQQKAPLSSPINADNPSSIDPSSSNACQIAATAKTNSSSSPHPIPHHPNGSIRTSPTNPSPTTQSTFRSTQPPFTTSHRKKHAKGHGSAYQLKSTQSSPFSPKDPHNIEAWARYFRIKLYKELEYPCLDQRYMNPYRPLKLSADRLTATGGKGWASVLASVCADVGSWYFEVRINSWGAGWEECKVFGWDACRTIGDVRQAIPSIAATILPSIRIGWGTRFMKFEAPVGYNPYGYSIIQSSGKTFNAGRTGRKGGVSSYIPIGSTIGCYLHMPGDTPQWILPDPRMDEKMWPFLHAGLLCNTTHDSTLPDIVASPNSFIEFSLDGKLLGRAFVDIACAEYHPCISCFNMASATVNLGPNFKYPPQDKTFRSACEMGTSRYPCKDDLIKCWIYSDEFEDSVDASGRCSYRQKTVAEVEGLYKRNIK